MLISLYMTVVSRQPFTGLVTRSDGVQHRHSCIGARLYGEFTSDNMSSDQIDYESQVCSEECELISRSGTAVRFASPSVTLVSTVFLVN